MTAAYVHNPLLRFCLGIAASGSDPIVNINNAHATSGLRITRAHLKTFCSSGGVTQYRTGASITTGIPFSLVDDDVSIGSAGDRIYGVVVSAGVGTSATPIESMVDDIAVVDPEGAPPVVGVQFAGSRIHIAKYNGTAPVPTAEDETGYVVLSGTAGYVTNPASADIAYQRGCKVLAVDTTFAVVVFQIR